jgi:hypothetical protein
LLYAGDVEFAIGASDAVPIYRRADVFCLLREGEWGWKGGQRWVYAVAVEVDVNGLGGFGNFFGLG